MNLWKKIKGEDESETEMVLEVLRLSTNTKLFSRRVPTLFTVGRRVEVWALLHYRDWYYYSVGLLVMVSMLRLVMQLLLSSLSLNLFLNFPLVSLFDIKMIIVIIMII